MCLPCCLDNSLEESAMCVYLASSTSAWRRVQCSCTLLPEPCLGEKWGVPTSLQAQLPGGECSVPTLLPEQFIGRQCVPTLLQVQLLGGECKVCLPCCQNYSLECNVCLPRFKYNCLEESAKCAYPAARTIPWRREQYAYLASRTIPRRRAHCVPTLTSCASCMVRGWWGSCCR